LKFNPFVSQDQGSAVYELMTVQVPPFSGFQLRPRRRTTVFHQTKQFPAPAPLHYGEIYRDRSTSHHFELKRPLLAFLRVPYAEVINATTSTVARFDDGFITVGTHYYHPDHLSTRLITDAAGNLIGQQGHFPFAETWYAQNTTSKWQFTSYERDSESGNDYAMARSYINRLGRFSSPDPVAGSANAPQSLNAFAYAQNDPINLADPSGMMMIPGRGFVDMSGTGNLWNEFGVMDIPVRIGTNYHFESGYNHYGDPFPFANYSFGELLGLAGERETGIYYRADLWIPSYQRVRRYCRR